jgi:hypothetical protein
MGAMLIRISSALFLALALVGTACGEDDDEDNPVPMADPVCQEIGEVCHGVPTDLGEECHELGHDGVAAVCAEREDECLAHCNEVGVGGAGGQGGGGGETSSH